MSIPTTEKARQALNKRKKDERERIKQSLLDRQQERQVKTSIKKVEKSKKRGRPKKK